MDIITMDSVFFLTYVNVRQRIFENLGFYLHIWPCLWCLRSGRANMMQSKIQMSLTLEMISHMLVFEWCNSAAEIQTALSFNKGCDGGSQYTYTLLYDIGINKDE